MEQTSLIIKISISVICLLSLIFLYLFGERLFQDNTEMVLQYQESADEVKDAFLFNPKELVYDGKGELDLLNGVTLENYNLQELRERVFVRITTGDTLSQKIVEYTIDTDEGRIRSKRILRLEDYYGPEIILPEEMPSVTIATIGEIKELLQMKEDYKADDGFGNDVRNYVQVETEKSSSNSQEINCVFSLENVFGDSTVAKTDILLSDVPAIIKLTDTEVILHVGDIFDPMIYVESATDSNGQSILEEVQYEDEINTEQPGEYEITYSLRDQTASLRVIVRK